MMVEYVRLTPDQRRALILSTGIDIANRNGLIAATHQRIARECTVDTSLTTVRSYFPNRADLLSAIISDSRTHADIKNQGKAMGL